MTTGFGRLPLARQRRSLLRVHAFSVASDPVVSQAHPPAKASAARRAVEVWLQVYDHVLAHVAGLFEAFAALQTIVS